MRNLLLLFLCIWTFIFVVQPVISEAARIKNGAQVLVSEKKTVHDNFYIGALTTRIDSEITQDLSVLANEATLNATVGGDVIVLGRTVTLAGDVDGDVRLIGADVVVRGNIDGDLVVVGGSVRVAPQASIEGDVIIVGGNAILDGEYEGQITAVAAEVSMLGVFNEEAAITTQRMILGDSVEINDHLAYFAPKRAEYKPQVIGEIAFNEIDSWQETGLVKRLILNMVSFWTLFKFITTLLLAFILVYAFRVFTQDTAYTGFEKAPRSLGVGVASFLVIPFIVTILVISIVAFPLAIILALLYVVALIITTAMSGIMLGVLIHKLLVRSGKKRHIITFHISALGVVLMTLIQLIPYVGDVIWFTLFLLSFGALLIVVFDRFRGKNIV